MVDHAEWFLFAWVFGNQAGVPLPVVPALLGAGVLAGSGYLSMAAIIGIAVGASLAADLTWYGLGRWRGARVLKILGRVAPNAGTLVSRARPVFFAHAGAFQLAARFLPEMNAIAAGLAGVTKVSTPRFVCYGAVSALIWAGGWTGLGYLLSQTVTETAARLGIRLIVLFLAPFALYLLFHRVRRHRLIRVFRQARLGPDDLEAAENRTPLLALAHSSENGDASLLFTPGREFEDGQSEAQRVPLGCSQPVRWEQRNDDQASSPLMTPGRHMS